MKTNFFAIVVLMILSSFVSVSAQNRLPYVLRGDVAGCDTVYTLPNQKAEFPGGMQAMYDFLNDNIKNNVNFVPAMSSRRVLLKMLVDSEGAIVETKLMMPTSTSLDDDLLRVVSTFPDMVPARYGNREVCSYLIIPLGIE
ncbi:MAG: hypothetical protein MJZ28_11215 [Paludibacteraceae bacterium]|nr:hypothetical protein [Paludibacteraceae bacterium]